MNKHISQFYKAAFLGASYVALSCLSSTDSYAQTSSKVSPFKGFYVGSNLAYTSGFSNEKFKTTVPAAGVSASASDKGGFDGIDGGINLGYTYMFSCLPIAMGLEGIANWSNVTGSHKFTTGTTVPPVNGTFTANIRMKQSLQLVARLGYAMEKAMPYVKLGWDNSSWNYKGNVNLTAPVLPDPVNVTAHTHKRLNGIAYGAGIDVALHKNLIAGLEYTHVDFQGQTISLPDGQTKASFKPHTNRFALTMKVMFN